MPKYTDAQAARLMGIKLVTTRKTKSSKTTRRAGNSSGKDYVYIQNRGALTVTRPYNTAYRPSQTIQKGKLPFGDRYLFSLPYVHFTALSGNSLSTFTPIVFSLNNMYDPDVTGGGHQCMQWDQISPIYAKYLVTKVRCELEWSNPSADGMYCAYNLINSQNVVAGSMSTHDISYVSEMRTSKMIVINNSGSQVKKVSFTVSINQLEGLSKDRYKGDEEYGAGVTANPLKQPRLELAVCDSNGGNANVAVKIRLTYMGILSGYQTQAQS